MQHIFMKKFQWKFVRNALSVFLVVGYSLCIPLHSRSGRGWGLGIGLGLGIPLTAAVISSAAQSNREPRVIYVERPAPEQEDDAYDVDPSPYQSYYSPYGNPYALPTTGYNIPAAPSS